MGRSFLLIFSLVFLTSPAAGEKKQNDTTPAWSPDGTKIAFVSTREGKRPQVYVMDADGANVRQVTDETYGADAPDWSPDGKRLAISVCTKSNVGASWVNRAGQTVRSMGLYPPEWDIHVIDVDGANRRRLTHDRGEATQPGWSPDGKTIVFTSAQVGPYQIFVMDADGTNRRQLTEGENPAWSPDGKKIAFIKWGGQGTNIFQIFTANRDGSDLRQLTGSEMKTGNPAWSPDGKRIAFTLYAAKVRQVYVMDADGANVQSLTRQETDSFFPAWSPDGKRIAYVALSADDGMSHIYVMAADGSDVRQLTGQKRGK